MKAIPEEYRNQIRTGLTVSWWGRRCSFEIVEEVSEAVFHNFWVWGLCILLYQTFEVSSPFLAIAFIIPALLFSGKAINEVASWVHEVYIVAFDETNGGGRVYKFHGWLNKTHIEEAITANSPTKIAERPFWLRMWRYFTGQGMERVKLYSLNHTFLEGRKMPYAFSRAIDQVSGHKPSKFEEVSPDLQILPYIQQMMAAGLLEREFAKDAASETVRKRVYGN